MNKIKFSHKYFKMPAAYETSKLSEVLIIDESDISESFREYDTCYENFDKDTGYALKPECYPLPKGKLILLLLIANSGSGWLWCTMRRWTPEKEKYYRSIRGQNVEIVIEGVMKKY